MDVSRRGFLKALGVGSAVALLNPFSFFEATSVPINTVQYGAISPKTAAYYSAELLKRAKPNLVLNKFGQAKKLPKTKNGTITFRRYANIKGNNYGA